MYIYILMYRYRYRCIYIYIYIYIYVYLLPPLAPGCKALAFRTTSAVSAARTAWFTSGFSFIASERIIGEQRRQQSRVSVDPTWVHPPSLPCIWHGYVHIQGSCIHKGDTHEQNTVSGSPQASPSSRLRRSEESRVKGALCAEVNRSSFFIIKLYLWLWCCNS